LQVRVLSALLVSSHNSCGVPGTTTTQRHRDDCRKVVKVARKIIDEPSEDIVANARQDRADKRGPLARLSLFFRQVINELRKVVTPTRRELLNYTLVVLVFVVIMMALVGGLDWLFSLAVNFTFGNGDLG
jgi:preprotein translocase subunit SecE